jgi:hypothetical protein
MDWKVAEQIYKQITLEFVSHTGFTLANIKVMQLLDYLCQMYAKDITSPLEIQSNVDYVTAAIKFVICQNKTI